MIDGKSITVNIKAIANELKARLDREPGEEEWKIWARVPMGDVGSVPGMAADLCKMAPQLGAELSDVKEKLRYGFELQSVEVMTELLIAVNTFLDLAALGAQNGAEAPKRRLAGLEELAALCKEIMPYGSVRV